ncbi:uncharacterized protein GGS22DRAFT_13569 [Annulohypoxylon maeteangense]|uniref:uncharacterized protein n=1 Tax=Annulohypoxylon maeteangense TaxID=1927788 RepID=UPI0020083A1F|nr:uncharacterized protein GGS22DRAFT_13569 [Annulohypoxylon maeteangense]KAI0890433.1 hypothetical protein GGS22DRAFT_13569 [Annulohypoxylon maeteangense]
MSVFSLIKRGRAQAKEHNAKQAERAKEEAVKLPYRHVVSHAASDALSGAPSSWKHADRPRIMEQNKRRTAIMAKDPNTTGLPRVGSSLSYVSYASVYGTPVVPLPRNYSYNNVPTSWRDQLANFHEGPDYFTQPVNGGSTKGKGLDHVRTPGSIGPAPRRSPRHSSTVSSKDVSQDSSTGNLSGSEDDLEMKTRIVINRRPQSIAYHSSASQQSTSSSEKSYRTPLTSAGTGNEPAAKVDRYYPPRSHSTYFSAPRPLSRRVPVAEVPVPPASVTERSNSTASSSTVSGHFSTASSTASIGLAIASPFSPSDIEPLSTPPTTKDRISPERKSKKTTTIDESHTQSARRSSTGQIQSSTDVSITKTSKQTITPETPPTQRRRRRLSKSKPPNSDAIRMSAETVRPARPSLSAITPTASNFDKVDNTIQQKVEEITVVTTSGSVRKSHGKLSKSPEIKETKPSRKGWFSLRPNSKTPTITAH